ncbi:MAG: hypothetical protein JWL96_2115 [Sphingomonas bacterium]|uniref:DUF6644 family protein n=1 Tax=Sphingomonas bacterium TaxID=1895847 RepID=UPI00263488C9|nr:DUF6644 family protein [Sphingomonas bacterium]MDB5710045.1 hypothetical protein [Sphingomonas bacterium]
MSSDLLQILYDSSLSVAIREGSSLFPWIESFHVLAITLVVGTIAIVDLRLLGYQSHRSGAKRLIRDMLPFTWGMFAIAATTGSLMFISNAPAYWADTQFRIKLGMIVLAGLNMAFFHVTAYRQIVDWDEMLPPPILARAAGATSLLLWILTVFFGRWVGFTLMPV